MSAGSDAHGLARFLDAQERAYPQALAELREGRKRGHWIWFVLPQVEGLGSSAMSRRYAIASLAEARAYLAHPVLGARLRECVDALLAHAGTRVEDMLGGLDAQKFRSCLTLFARADPTEPRFRTALDAFYGGSEDPATLASLDQAAST